MNAGKHVTEIPPEIIRSFASVRARFTFALNPLISFL